MFEKSAETLEEGVNNIIEAAKLDYAKWTDRASKGESRSEYFERTLKEFEEKCSVQTGRNYIKVVRDNSVHCFVVAKVTDKLAKRGFKIGDILKPAGYNAPALNKARGNVLDGNFAMNWTGPLYLN
jgi:hypothetical protein